MAKRTWTGAAADGKFDTAGNWAEGVVPVTGDDVYFEFSDKDLSDSLDQSAVRLASLHVAETYTGKIGTEAAYLKIGAAAVVIGEHYGFGSPAGSPRIKLDLQHFDGQAGPVVEVLDSATSSADASRPPVRLLTHDADARLYVRKGHVGVAVELPSETATLDGVHVSFDQAVETDANVVLGPGVTWTTINKTGGEVVAQSAGTTVVNAGGTVKTTGSGAIGTMTVSGGYAYPESTGTITALECRGGTTDFTRSRQARTVTTPKLWRGATLKYDPAVVTMTAPPAPQEAMALAAQAA